jgi:imidazole glycerol phosphate synthase subunit HisF
VQAEGDAEFDTDASGVNVDVDVAAGVLLSPFDVDGADDGFDLVQVSKFPSARSNAVLKSGSCCLIRKLFMGGMVLWSSLIAS